MELMRRDSARRRRSACEALLQTMAKDTMDAFTSACLILIKCLKSCACTARSCQQNQLKRASASAAEEEEENQENWSESLHSTRKSSPRYPYLKTSWNNVLNGCAVRCARERIPAKATKGLYMRY